MPVAPSDFGIQHFCVYVDDIDAAAARLEKAGGVLLSAPGDLPGGDAGAGNQYVYARTPWGSTVELVTYPSPQAYEATTSLRRWRPEPHPRGVMNPRFELAHLAHAELLTPNMEGTLWFFTELLGMREVARQGDSVYLRCYEDPYHHSLKVTGADAPGLANLGWRTTSAEALERRAVALDAAGRGPGLDQRRPRGRAHLRLREPRRAPDGAGVGRREVPRSSGAAQPDPHPPLEAAAA